MDFELEPAATARPNWPAEGLTRVPYWVFQDRDLYETEQQRIFRGPTWNYLCLEAEIPEPGDFLTSFVGETPVVVTRDKEGAIHAFENRCAHRGALICLESRGNTDRFACVYHGWTYDHEGNLKSVAFQRGVQGKGGMPASFKKEEHGPRKLATVTVFGLVFGSFAQAPPPIDDYLGPEIHARVARVLDGRKPVVLGRYTQMLPNNWKLYFENVKDSYHASILHLFFTTFDLNKLSMRGGIVVSPSGGHHVSFSAIDREVHNGTEYKNEGIRSESGTYRLADPSLLHGFKEFADDVTLQILTVFPGFVLQQIQNALAIRQILPHGIAETALNWTYFGFADDTREQRTMRLKQANLMGPGGYVSMEDGCVGGFIQRGIAGASTERAVLEMGGASAESQDGRVTESSVRGFWKQYRSAMEL